MMSNLIVLIDLVASLVIFKRCLGRLSMIRGNALLEDGFRYWRLCLLLRSIVMARFHHNPTFMRRYFSTAYKKWWALVHGNFLEEHAARLVDPSHGDASPRDSSAGPSTNNAQDTCLAPTTMANLLGPPKRKKGH